MPATAWLQVIWNQMGLTMTHSHSRQTCRQNAWKFLPDKSEGQKNLGISWGQGILETETCENQTWNISTVVKCPSDAWFWIFARRCPAWSVGSVWHQKCHSALRPLNLTRSLGHVIKFRAFARQRRFGHWRFFLVWRPRLHHRLWPVL